MSTLPININDEKAPLLPNNDHLQVPTTTDKNHRGSICHPRNDTSPTDTSVGPCAKYGHEDDLTASAIHNTKRAKRKLIIACCLCLIFLIVEFVGEYCFKHDNGQGIIEYQGHSLR